MKLDADQNALIPFFIGPAMQGAALVECDRDTWMSAKSWRSWHDNLAELLLRTIFTWGPLHPIIVKIKCEVKVWRIYSKSLSFWAEINTSENGFSNLPAIYYLNSFIVCSAIPLHYLAWLKWQSFCRKPAKTGENMEENCGKRKTIPRKSSGTAFYRLNQQLSQSFRIVFQT